MRVRYGCKIDIRFQIGVPKGVSRIWSRSRGNAHVAKDGDSPSGPARPRGASPSCRKSAQGGGARRPGRARRGCGCEVERAARAAQVERGGEMSRETSMPLLWPGG